YAPGCGSSATGQDLAEVLATVVFQAATSRRRPVELAFSGHARGDCQCAPTSPRQHCCRRLTPSQREWACAHKYAPPASTNEWALQRRTVMPVLRSLPRT